MEPGFKDQEDLERRGKSLLKYDSTRLIFGPNDSRQQFESSLVYFSIARSGVSKAQLRVGENVPVSVTVRSDKTIR